MNVTKNFSIYLFILFIFVCIYLFKTYFYEFDSKNILLNDFNNQIAVIYKLHKGCKTISILIEYENE